MFVVIFKLNHTFSYHAQYSDHKTPVNNVTCFWLANHSSPYAKDNFQE